MTEIRYRAGAREKRQEIDIYINLKGNNFLFISTQAIANPHQYQLEFICPVDPFPEAFFLPWQ